MYTTPRKPKPASAQNHNICWPILDLDEIIAILAGFELNLSEDQLLKPTQQITESIYLRLVSSLLGTDLEQVAEAFSQCSAQTQNETSLYDGFVLLAVQKPIFSLFQDCGVHDFCMDDILHPTPKRLRMLLSAFINYARFRECREEWALYMRQSLDDQSAQVRSRVQERAQKLERVKQLRSLVADTSLEIELANNELKKAELNNLADRNLELMEDKNRLKPQLKAIVARLDQQQQMVNKLNGDIFSLKTTISEDPVSLRKNADSLHQQVSLKKHVSNTLHQRAQKLDISIQSLRQFKVDLDALKCASQNLDSQKTNLQEIHDRHLRLSHLFEQSLMELENGDRDMRRSQHECDQLEGRIQVVRQQREKLNKEAETRMAQLRKQLGVEYGEKALVVQNIGLLKEDLGGVEKEVTALKEGYLVDYRTAVMETERVHKSLAGYVKKLKNGVL